MAAQNPEGATARPSRIPEDLAAPVLTSRSIKGQNGQNGQNGHTALHEPRADYTNGHAAPAVKAPTVQPGGKAVLAMFCPEAPISPIGRYLGKLATALVKRGTTVHIFSEETFGVEAQGAHCHPVGAGTETDPVARACDFGHRACKAFQANFPAGTGRVTLLGHEWTSIPALREIRLNQEHDALLLLHSLERQRSDMTNDLSRRIEELEHAGLRDCRAVLVHEPATAEVARFWLPECAPRVSPLRQCFPAYQFDRELDAGDIKAKYQVGPIDPMILFIGDFDQRHGVDVVMKSVPAVLRNHKQARFVFVGEGDLFWPMRVHARYLLLEHAVRLLGDIRGDALHDLILAADMIVVPSRDATEWWQVQAAWAAGKPVVVSHPLAAAMGLKHEEDCVAVYPHESSCVWGIERLLFHQELRENLGRTGKSQVDDRFGWSIVAEQIEELMAVPAQ